MDETTKCPPSGLSADMLQTQHRLNARRAAVGGAATTHDMLTTNDDVPTETAEEMPDVASLYAAIYDENMFLGDRLLRGLVANDSAQNGTIKVSTFRGVPGYVGLELEAGPTLDGGSVYVTASLTEAQALSLYQRLENALIHCNGKESRDH